MRQIPEFRLAYCGIPCERIKVALQIHFVSSIQGQYALFSSTGITILLMPEHSCVSVRSISDCLTNGIVMAVCADSADYIVVLFEVFD